MKEKQHLITLLRLLAYVKKLKYTNKSLTSEFRRYRFPLRDFLNYNNLTPNYYQVKKLKTFFDLVKNILIVEIWLAEELFHYLHPFLFNDFFQQKLTKHQFQVLFEIIKNYSSVHLRKEFNITQFLDNYPRILYSLSNKVFQITDLNLSHSQIAVFENNRLEELHLRL